jgi:hypothetical protein
MLHRHALPPLGLALLAAAFLALPGARSAVGPVALRPQPPAPKDLGPPQSIALETGKDKGRLTLAGQDAVHQLLVTGRYAGGAVRDLTGAVRYQASPAGVVHVDESGLVTPLKESEATVEARTPEGLTAKMTVTVRHLEDDLPINFANEVVPLFTKFGCNAGGCHGKASGQNGFKLSLLGFEPAEDYEFLVKEGRGRRLLPSAPEHSLLLRKATGAMAHGGGKKIEPGSPSYRVLLRWVRQGAPYGRPDDAAVRSIEVFPKDRVLERGGRQQLKVLAHLSDGTTRDVTRMTQFEANHADLAEVSDTGLVRVKNVPGRVAVMTRFQSHVDAFRATVPLGAPLGPLPAPKTFIDELVFKQWKELGLPPSEVCDDATFLRRATIDLAGRLPTAAETREFVASKEANKHEKLIDRLLASGDFADYFANKWSAVLRNRRAGANEDTTPTFAFHAWLRASIDKNKPYDQFVREVLTATGEEGKSPPVVWYRELKEPANLVEDAAQLFLGQRIGCAKCHHHPFEKWGQEDYWGMAAFFSRVRVTPAVLAKKGRGKNAKATPGKPARVAHVPGVAQAVNPRTGKPVKPTGLGGRPVEVAPDDDPRVKLVDWMVRQDNPFFARALANRYWKHFLGRGLVEPEDDLRATNPASNPELLDALAKYFVDSKYNMKKLVRAICTSHVYRLSAVPNRHNADDRQSFSRFLPRRLHAEVLLDAIDAVTLSKTTFRGAPPGARAVQLPDNLFDSYFLSVFGRPDAASACECERSGDASLAQALHMMNSEEILGKAGGPRARDLARDRRPHAERLRELYLVALSREPTKEETQALVEHIGRACDAQAAYEDVIWALINTKEFLFNH